MMEHIQHEKVPGVDSVRIVVWSSVEPEKFLVLTETDDPETLTFGPEIHTHQWVSQSTIPESKNSTHMAAAVAAVSE